MLKRRMSRGAASAAKPEAEHGQGREQAAAGRAQAGGVPDLTKYRRDRGHPARRRLSETRRSAAASDWLRRMPAGAASAVPAAALELAPAPRTSRRGVQIGEADRRLDVQPHAVAEELVELILVGAGELAERAGRAACTPHSRARG